jgi:hypothetical protein
MEYMRYSVSDTAEYGDYTRGPRIVDSRVKDEMRKILTEIQSGEFAREWILENHSRGTNSGHLIPRAPHPRPSAALGRLASRRHGGLAATRTRVLTAARTGMRGTP